MIVYAFVEGILIIFIFSRFFMYFGRKFSKNHVSVGIRAFVRLLICSIVEEFSTKINEKSRKNENYQKSFDKSIDNHVYVPETEARIIWSDPGKINREKSVFIINSL